MSQTTITSFYNSRKRAAVDDIVTSKSKVPHIERASLKSVRKTPIGLNSVSLETKKLLLQNEKVVSKIVHAATTEDRLPAPQQEEEPPAFTKKTNNANIEKKPEPSKSDTVKAARQELSLGDIKKKLAGSSRLAELRARAESLSQGIQKLKQDTEKKNLKEFKSIDVEIPASPSKREFIQSALQSPRKDAEPKARLLMSPRKVVVSPVKSPTKVPAYIRHASLATASTSLPLPHQYRFLAELFRGMETVASLLFNRNEKITFSKLKPSVQEMLKRNFTEKHLAQIKYLVPDFYNFEVQKIKNFSNTAQKEAYELVVTPNFPNDIKSMNPTVLLERRRYFYDTLMQLVKKHHSQYLLTLDPPMVIPDSKLTRWHPEFELEKVAEVECAKLPEMPNTEKFTTAQDVLSKARELFKCNTKMERAMEKLAQAKVRGLTEAEKVATGFTDKKDAKVTSAGTQTQPSTSGVTLLNPALRNLPASLLEKVKAKQAAKALEAMTRTSEHDHKFTVYSRLPDLARTLRNIYVTERKNVLALNIVLSKLDSSFKANVPSSELQSDIKILAEEVPDWIKLHDIRNTTYLKLDKNVDLKTIISKLESKAQQYKFD